MSDQPENAFTQEPAPRPRPLADDLPTASAETAFSTEPTARPRPPGAVSPQFLARLRGLLQQHRDLHAKVGPPPMWTVLQLLALITGLGVGFTLAQSLNAKAGNERWAPLVFLGCFLAGALVPDLLLKMIRKAQFVPRQQALEEALRLTLRTYPDEVEQAGGVAVLADPVELEALIHVLATKEGV